MLVQNLLEFCLVFPLLLKQDLFLFLPDALDSHFFGSLVVLDALRVTFLADVLVLLFLLDLASVRRIYKQIVRFRLHIDFILLSVQLSCQPLEVIVELEVPVLVIDSLILRDATQVRDHDFCRGCVTTVCSCLATQALNIKLPRLKQLTLLLLLRLDFLLLDRHATILLVHFLNNLCDTNVRMT